MNELFEQRNFTTGPISNVNNGPKNLRYLGPKVWNTIPPDIRNSGNMEEFTRKIKCFAPTNCSCKLYLHHIHHVGYVNFCHKQKECLFWDLTMAASGLKCYS